MLHIRARVHAKFGANWSRDDWEKFSIEKKSREKHNITVILKSCIFAKNGNIIKNVENVRISRITCAGNIAPSAYFVPEFACWDYMISGHNHPFQVRAGEIGVKHSFFPGEGSQPLSSCQQYRSKQRRHIKIYSDGAYLANLNPCFFLQWSFHLSPRINNPQQTSRHRNFSKLVSRGISELRYPLSYNIWT